MSDTSLGKAPRTPWNVPMLAEARAGGRKLVMLTGYDAGFARVLDDNGVDLILVGDSLGMVVQGRDSTLAVTVDDIVYHTACVARGAANALKIAGFPFGSDTYPRQAHAAAVRFVQAGAAMVKLEGAGPKLEVIRYLVEREIPVCAHLGLTPQSVLRFGGFKVKGREQSAADRLRQEALDVAAAGASLLVLEGVPAALASQITAGAVPYSAQALAELRAQGRPVFVNMTADWCVSCKANERAVLARDEFRAVLRETGTAYMVGDYTDVDPAITAYLQEHKAVGVPL